MKSKSNPFLRSASLAASILFSLAGAIQAQTTYYWDGGTVDIAGNGNGASAGTTGTWNTTLKNWDVGASPYVSWVNSYNNTAVLAASNGGNVTVTGTIQLGTLNALTTGGSNSYNITGGTLDFGSSGIITNSGQTAQSVILASLLKGKITFTPQGGTLSSASSFRITNNNVDLTETVLNGANANTNIIIENAGALGAASATVKLTKGVLGLGNSATTPVSYNAWATELAGGAIRARLGNSTWNGATTLTANSLLTTRAASDSKLTFSSTGTINLNANTLTLTAASASSGIFLNGVISGSGNLLVASDGLTGGANGTGTVTLGAANSFNGTATTGNNFGTLALGNVDALQNATLDTAASGTQSVTFMVAGNNTYNLGALAGSDALAIGGNTISVGSKAVDTVFNADISGASGNLTKVGSNKLTLSAATSYSGTTQITGGTLALSGSGMVNSSSGITVNGGTAKLLHTGSTAISPTVTLTNGTLTGSGTVDTVSVGAGTGGKISNNDGVAGAALTIGSLTLAGGANINLYSNGASTAADLIVTTLTNNSTAGQVIITANNALGWTNGSTYDLISYTTLGGTGLNNFGHAVNNLSARQAATWGDSGSAITLAIAGDNPRWMGDGDGNWNLASANNWKLVTGGGYTTFLATDDVLFDSNATGPTTVDIDVADVAANTTLFNNTTAKSYTLESSGGFGISTGSLTKSNSGSVTITNANSFTGGTTLNDGTLNIDNASALGGVTSAFTINGGTIDNTSGGVTTVNYPLTINGDFAFSGTNALNLGTGAATLGSAAGTSRTITVNANTLTLGGIIGNGTTANTLIKTGAGTLVLSGANTLSAVTVNGGVLTAENASALGAAGALTSGTLNLNAAALAGTLTLNGGTLDNTSGVARTTANGTRTFNGDFAFTGSNDLNLGTGAISLGTAAGTARTITANAGILTLGGVISDGTTATGLTKSGNGTLTLNGASNYTGITTINGGKVIAGNNAALGTNAGGTTISGGGTLDINARNLGTEIITISGTGVGGNGALVNNGASQINAIGRLVLGANATIGGSGRWDLRNTTPTLDMGGFTLTKTGANGVGLVAVTGSNAGNIDVAQGVFGIQLATDLGGTSANKVTVRNGATLEFYEVPTAFAWSVDVENNGTIWGESGSGTQNTLTGPIAIAAGGTAILKADAVLTLSGDISGSSSSINKTGAGTAILSGSNSYGGLTTVNGGELRVTTAAAIGGSNVEVLSGRLALDGGITVSGKSLTTSGNGANFFGGLQSFSGTNEWTGSVLLGANDSRIGARKNATLVVSGAIDDGANTFNLVVRNENQSNTSGAGNATTITELSGVNTYGGNTVLIAGVTRLAVGDNRLPTGTILQFGGTGANAKFDMNGRNQEVAGLAVMNTVNDTQRDWNANELTNSSGTLSTLTVNTAADQTFGLTTTSFSGSGNYTGIITGNIALEKSGSAKLTLSGANTYTGDTSIKNGSVILTGGNDRLLTTGSVSLGDVATSGKLVLGDATTARNQTLGGLTSTGLGGNVVGANATTDSVLTLNIASGTNTYGGVLGGTGTDENQLALSKSGSGTLELTGVNTYNGGTTVSAGTVVLANNSAAGSAGISLTGATSALQINSGITVGNDITLSNESATVSRSLGDGAAYTVGTGGALKSSFASSYADTTATILAGTNSTDSVDATLNMLFNDTSAASNDGIRRSDVFSISGSGSDTFVIQLSAAGLATDSVLGWNQSGTWVNAVTGNTGAAGSLAGSYAQSFTDFLNANGGFNAATMLGAFGFDSGGSSVWAVVDHTGSFAAIPEPTSALVGLLIGAGLLRRRRVA